MKLFASLLLIIAITNSSYYQIDSTQWYTGPIIDMHLHDYNEKTYYVAPAIDGTVSPPGYTEFRKEVFRLYQKFNVVKAVVSANGTEVNLDDNEILIPGYYSDGPPNDIEDFKIRIKSGNLKVFGELGPQYVGMKLSDPDFAPYLKICEENNIPVAIHTGGGPPDVTHRLPKFRIELGDPYHIEDVLVKYPDLKIYLMHAGTSFYEHTLEMMRTYTNLYVDLGVILWWDKPELDFAEAFLRKAKRYGYLDRVM